jgi:hypothetical protein
LTCPHPSTTFEQITLHSGERSRLEEDAMTGRHGRELVLPPVDDIFRAVARSIVPETESQSPQAWDALEDIVEHTLADRSPALRRQLQLFLRVLDLLPLLRYGRRLRGLDLTRRTRFLAGIQDSRIHRLRQGFWGLRTLVYMGYYARPEAGEAIGYDARLRGWLEHPAAPAEARAEARMQAGAGEAGRRVRGKEGTF